MECAFEKYSNCVAETAILNAHHWIELYGKKDFRCNFSEMVELEKKNGLAYYTLRENNILCGHVAFMLINTPYINETIALDAFYYISPEYRGTFGMCKLLKFAGKHLISNNIKTIIVSQKIGMNLDSILNIAGFYSSGNTFLFKDELL
jgi:hypothetical protein